MNPEKFLTADLALRYWPVLNEDSSAADAPPAHSRGRRQPAGRLDPVGRRILCFDTETWTDELQESRFGAFGLYTRTRDRGPYSTEFGFFMPEGMQTASPKDFAALKAFCDQNGFRLLSLPEFLEDYFFPECYRIGSVCLGFNLPFDLSRLAVEWGVCEGAHRDAFWLRLSPLPGYPRIRIKPLNERGAQIEFLTPRSVTGEDGRRYRPGAGAVSWFPGRFLDGATLAKALSGEGCTLAEACRRFGVPEADGKASTVPHGAPLTAEYCQYAIQDVRATFGLYLKLAEVYGAFPFATFQNETTRNAADTPITNIFSPASLSKALLRKAGIGPYHSGKGSSGRLHVPPQYQGYAAAAFYGGRMDVGIRRVEVPVTTLDFSSQYPAAFLLLGLWRWLAAETLTVRENQGYLRDTQALLDRIAVDPDLLFNPETWTPLAGFCQFIPTGDLLPSRASWGAGEAGDLGNLCTTLAPLQSDAPMWYSLPDAAASAARTGSAPRLLRAFTAVPGGTVERSVLKFHGTTLDPADPSFLSRLISIRSRLQQEGRTNEAAGIKAMVNALCFGIFAEVNREYFASPPKSGEAGADVRRIARLFSEGELSRPLTGSWEKPGGYCNWLLASLVTGAGRLLLSLLEGEVLRRGGAVAWVTVDSAAVVTGLSKSLPAVNAVPVEDLQRKFERLNPFDRQSVPAFLKSEEAGAGFCISPARYCIGTEDGDLLKANLHGCSGVIDPEGRGLDAFGEDLWRIVLERDRREDADQEELEGLLPAAWKAQPLRRAFTIRSPRTWRQARAILPGIRPFSFLQTVSSATGWAASGERRAVYGPYRADGKASLALAWWDPETGRRVRLVEPGLERRAGEFPFQRVADFLSDFECHRALAMVDSDGNPCLSGTRGLVTPHAVRRRKVFLCGKETNRLIGTLAEEAPIEEPTELVAVSSEPLPPLLLEAIQSLASYQKALVAKTLGVHPRSWERICVHERSPGMELRHRIFLLARGVPEDAPPCAAERKQAILRAAANLPRPWKP